MHDVRKVYFPYCLQRQPNGCHVILNRLYKPLGSSTTEWVDYEKYSVTLVGLAPRIAARLSWAGSKDLDNIYLYDDATIPTNSARNMAVYLARLKVLMRLRQQRGGSSGDGPSNAGAAHAGAAGLVDQEF
jgi:hypothetical protein